MQLILLRHAQTVGNLMHRYLGRTNEPLCTEGIETARAARDTWGKQHFQDVTEVHSSPLLRARQTAKVCFPNASIVNVEDFREMDFGRFEGKTHGRLMADEELGPIYTAWIDDHYNTDCPEGESYTAFVKRTTEAFRDLVLDASAAGKSQLVIVAHGGTLMAILSTFDIDGHEYYDYQVGNCEGFTGEIVVSDNDPTQIAIQNLQRLQ